MSDTWSPRNYQQHAASVPALGAWLLARLAPKAGERILDAGCGEGVLTRDLASGGADVVAVDGSPQTGAAAVARDVLPSAVERPSQCPVWPKPPSARAVSGNVSAGAHTTCSTAATTICATRIPGVTVNGSPPWLIRMAFTSPR